MSLYEEDLPAWEMSVADALRSQEHSVGTTVPEASERCRRIVHEVEEIARAFAGRPLSLSEIYQEASVGPGMIRLAFRLVHGLPPRRFLQHVRLRAVHAELHRAGPRLTVTDVATSHGFVELGRFAVQYRAAFGESPSTTLRRAQMRWEAGKPGQMNGDGRAWMVAARRHFSSHIEEGCPAAAFAATGSECSELVVDAAADDVHAIHAGAGACGRDVKVFRLGGPIGRKSPLSAASQGKARPPM